MHLRQRPPAAAQAERRVRRGVRRGARRLLRTLPALTATLLLSCGDASKTHGTTLEEFARKLEAMKTRFETPCDACEGKPMLDPETGEEDPCAACGGTGRVKGVRGPTLEEFIEAFGEPALDEPRPGDLIWRRWYYPCSEGRMRVPVYLEEEPGEPVRVMTGKPELE